MTAFPELPLQTIVRSGEGDEYEISSDEGQAKDTVSVADILALIPLSQGFKSYGEFVLVSLSSKEAVSDDNTQSAMSTKFSLRQHRVSHPPTELEKFAVDTNFSSFFTRAQDSPAHVELSIIVSVKSGTCLAEPFFRGALEKLLTLLGFSKDRYKVYFTDSEKWITQFASKTLCDIANKGIAQSVLLLSGDGGVIDILNGLYGHTQSTKYVNPRIGLVVLGTGNALANSSGLNTGNTKGLPAILTGSPHNIPTFVCKCSPGSVLLVDEGRATEGLETDSDECGILHGAVVASWCLHATLVADSDTTEYRKFGSERFSMAANQLLAPSDGSPPHKWKGKITTFHQTNEGKTEARVWHREEHMYILATLVSNLEATLRISPNSKPLDGTLRMVEFPPLPAVDVKSIFGMAFNGGKHIEHESVGYEPIEGLRIDFEEADARWRRICIDGKIIRIPEGGWVEVKLEDRIVADLMMVP